VSASGHGGNVPKNVTLVCVFPAMSTPSTDTAGSLLEVLNELGPRLAIRTTA
jgi:hypothetical protein